ncbi:hypothetical protein [Streptomyces sp. ME19-01-6]|uniref:hypothetical protein n=1 Tax=Streptomyces sp. ME19-01-6 TaxID=3028686 RepID=UPI0029AE10FE|nr:hypothetical protein [Streptomyces sp. ME19-01-6]MDX3233040.1 hypothetical protein [Streptomyces sp. ME19-01-6]
MMRRRTRRDTLSSTAQSWTSIFHDRPDSRDAGLPSEAVVRVEWRHSPHGPANQDARCAASRAARFMVEKVLASESVLRTAAAEQELAAALRQQRPVHRDGVELLNVSVTLRVDDDVAAGARRAERARHEFELDEMDRRQARARVEFLREELLANPSAARLYTLLQNSPRIGGPPDGSDPHELVRQIHQWHPHSRWVLIAQTLHTFVGRLTEDNAQDFLKILRSAMTTLGHRQLAEEIAAAEGAE